MALSPFVRQRLTTFISTEHHSSIETLAGHLASGAVVPAIGERFALDGVADALRQMEAGHTRGKSVIVVRGDVSPR
jgi:NADPH:quinone reductase-like Zn-dependent oxidoreductase